MVYDFQRMKMMTVKKVPKSTRVYAKERKKLREIEFSFEGDAGGHTDHLHRPDITIDETAAIAELVTIIDTKHELGVQALWLILHARDEGATVEEAMLFAKKRISEEVKNAKARKTKSSKA